ncbi:Helix-loop-helix DNA-binding domain protein [Teladorsagia circumcincta]|uniref:Helix-loop-helix DNA-binding domain protein n=1 Tax=Teladorsagia circumcincta TaxID=45464 RepID=A0A2G9TVV9_TELCI|nr:Helix-loop-helix DNA-binding domain protein [Teladorsagia circumcincta]
MTRQSSTSSSPDENRRLRSTLKEKKRNIEINDAFEKLQRQLPHVPSSTRLPKIKTLRLALKYIEHLNTILSGDKQIMSDYMSNPRPLCVEDFAAVAMQEIQVSSHDNLIT